MKRIFLTVLLGLCFVFAYGTPTGTLSFCVGASSTLTDATGGGTWSSSNTAVATIGSSSGTVFGVAAGTARISYIQPGGSFTYVTVTVNTLPSVISGASSVCTNSYITLSNSISGGTWTSSNTSAATIGSASGYLTGIAAGATIVFYTLPTGCARSVTITVNQAPAPITGPGVVCVGSTIALSDGITGGTWTSGNPLYASVGSTSGVVSGLGAASATIKYTLSNGCYVTQLVTVNPLPFAIAGVRYVCEGSLTILSDASSGGHWSSNTTTVATVGSGDGFVTGVTAGTTIISYALNTGCARTAIVTVNPLPSAILGATHVCAGSTTALSDAMTGGTWTSSNTTFATINVSSGVVTGVNPGTTTISYKLTTGCINTMTMTVDSLPSPITGVAKVCVGLITNLTDATPGGSWSASAGASADGSGGVTGISAGTSIISYTLGTTGCRVTKTVTVNPVPLAITGSPIVCAGSTTALTDATIGGTWSSSDGSLAFVSSTGLVSAVAAGNPVITYQLSTGCNARVTLTVQITPVAIAGVATVCAGSVTALTNTTAGGTWSSSTAAIGTVDGSGNVNGIAPGTTTITYALSTGCMARRTVTVNSLPAAISGASAVCTGSNMTLSDTPTGGTWSSSDIAVAAVTGTGVVSGFTAGTVNITYTLGTGCAAIHLVTVNPAPPVLSGSLSVCIGSVTALSDAAGGGTWSSSNTAIGSVDGSGNVTGIAAGTTTISYVVGTGCRTTATVAVIALPAVIIGPSSYCTGVTVTLSDATPSGTWSSSDAATASISGTGVVIPIVAGTATISYTAGTGCVRTLAVTVNTSPLTITGGAPYVCIGSTTTFSDGTPGGTWVSGAPGLATIGSTSGTASGVAVGSTTITYLAANGCVATVPLAVHVGPSPIYGSSSVCERAFVTLSDGLTSGTWSSSDLTVGTIGAISGALTGVSAGTTIITYALSSSCLVTKTITVNTAPVAIAGTLTSCPGIVTSLSDAVGGGVWSSGSPAVAGIGSGTGVVTAGIAGTARITYSISGCNAYVLMTVNPLPYLIGGSRHVCPGLMTSLTDLTLGGAWSSGAPGNAIVGSTGFVTGVTAGTNEITYTLPTGCMRIAVVTVDPLPAPISGSGHVCLGLTTTLSDAPVGGTWTSGTSGVATIIAASGVAHGVSAGTTVITYRLPTSCIMTTVLTVDPLPSPISGLTNVCVGLTTPLTEAAGGTWSSSNTAIATIDAGGLVTGVSPGSVIITYTLGTGCIRTMIMNVRPLPLPITGPGAVCAGSVITLSDATVYGTWSGDNAAVATVSAYGNITGVSIGTVIVSYTLPTGCMSTKTVTVNALPPAILGSAFVCVGLTTSLSDPAGAGTWSSSNPAIASVGSATGIVSGLVSGGATITYRQASTGCRITTPFVVNALPPAIYGALSVCAGASSLLTDVAAGGTWSSSNGSVALIGLLSGLTNAVAPGTTTITYTSGVGCIRTATLTVNQVPAPISGAANMCAASSITLSVAVGGGSWSSGNIYVAMVGGSTGVVHGIAAGTAAITYTLPGNCKANAVVTVTPNPVAIYGTRSVCVSSYTLLTDPTVGGTWSSSNPAVANVSLTSGNVAGMAAGTATITYAIGACFKTATVTVNPFPGPINGNTTICVGTVSALSDDVPGGTWTTGNIFVAAVSSAGVVTAAAVGTANITYSLGAGCRVMTTVVVNPGPAAITGSAVMCKTNYTPFTDASAGGLWSSSNTSVVSIGFVSGWALGEATGTATITYSISTGCYTTKTVTVNPMPSVITPTAPEFCNGTTIVLHDSIPGGYWTSANTAIATAGSLTGVISGIAEGTATITYRLPTGCATTVIVTVDRSPAAIVGPSVVCVGSHIFLSDATVAGVWSASNGSATIDLSGNVVGIYVGRDTVTYALSNGCKATLVLTVNTYAAPITGDTHVCTSSTTLLSDVTPGGFWSSSDPSLAAIGSGTGIVTGIAAGTVTISYQIPGGCMSFMLMTIDQGPGVIEGTMYFCESNTVTLTDSVPGGTWSSSTPSVAFAAPLTGVITGASGGTATISYRLSEGCAVTAVVTVSPVADAGTISGYAALCLGSSFNLSTNGQQGIWRHTNPYITRVDSLSGLVSSLSVGVDTVFYTVVQLCTVDTSWWQMTVGPEVVINSITGNDNVCVYSTDSLQDETPGGNWFSSNPALATVDVNGVLSALSPGLDTVAYVVYGSCAAVKRKSVVIDALPTHPGISINPGSSVCSNSMYMNIGAGVPQTDGFLYTWTATNADIYAIGSNMQNMLVNFTASGTAVIRLTTELVITGCSVTDSFVTNVGSSASPNASVLYTSPDFTCTDGSADSYQWGYDAAGTLDSTLIPGATSQTYTLASPLVSSRFYWVITSHGGCLQKAYYNLPPAESIANAIVGNFEFALFPNPASRKINIEVKGLNSNDEISVKLFDMLGREMQGCPLSAGKGEINVADLAQGVYSVILVKDGMKVGARTFVKN